MFDSVKLDELIDEKFNSNKELMLALNNMGYEIKEDAIKKWRQGNSVPKVGALPFLSKLLGCTELDFYSDSEQTKEKITNQEILSNPQKYSQSISTVATSSFPPEMKMFINSFMLLSDEEKQHYYEEIADIAARKLTI